jgi:hypothetical protein
LRALCQALRAERTEEAKIDHALLTPVLTAAVVLAWYALVNAAARALYAPFCALVKAVIAVPSAASRALTAVPTHAILVAVEVAGDAVCAKAGTAAAIRPRAIVAVISVLVFIQVSYLVIRC